jgi:hypothetical protein
MWILSIPAAMRLSSDSSPPPGGRASTGRGALTRRCSWEFDGDKGRELDTDKDRELDGDEEGVLDGVTVCCSRWRGSFWARRIGAASTSATSGRFALLRALGGNEDRDRAGLGDRVVEPAVLQWIVGWTQPGRLAKLDLSFSLQPG